MIQAWEGYLCGAAAQAGQCSLIYFGDTAHLPYGDKSPDQLMDYFRASLAFLESRGCTGLVVACNTTSSVVLPRIKHLVKLPLVA